MNRERLLERFLRYVQIDTTAVEQSDHYPSSAGQLELGRLLVEELHDAGIDDARQDDHGLVWATVPATGREDAPVVALNAHLDTSPETSGANVQPQIVRDYRGGDIPLPGDPRQVIRVEDNPALTDLVGSTLVTSDGTTLLGGDDKAGVAVIMEAVAHWAEHPEIPHGPMRILFTCDEEIGRGVDHVDLERLQADVAYTVDGPGADNVDTETFSADLAIVTARGINIHPSIANGRMVNALRVTADFLARLPKGHLAPESTEGREGFLHPYQTVGGVGEVQTRILLRDFQTEKLAEYADSLRQYAREVEVAFPGCAIDVEIHKQYRNMSEGLAREPRAVTYVQRAMERLGRTPTLSSIRGGTDGSQLTERGLATPNLSTGQHNQHSPQEWVCLEEMTQAAELLIALAEIWHEDPGIRDLNSE
jgi:tripeptide aminopeptidase